MDKYDKKALPGEFWKSILAMRQGLQATPMIESLSRSFRESALKGTPSGTEFSPEGIVIPLECLRANQVGTATGGGYTSSTDPITEIDPSMLPASVTIAAGAQVITGCRGDKTFPLEQTRMAVSFRPELEGTDPSESDGTYAVLVERPRRMFGATSVSMQLGAQTGDILRFLGDSIRTSIAQALDEASLVGDGLAGSIKGIFNTPNVGTVVFSGAATGTLAADYESQITTNDGIDQNISFVAHPAVRKKWKNVDRFSSGGLPLWSDDEKVLGKRAFVTSALAATDIVAGDFTKQITCFWGEGTPVQILVDRISDAKSGKIRLVVTCFADSGFLRPTLFVKNSGSAVQ